MATPINLSGLFAYAYGDGLTRWQLRYDGDLVDLSDALAANGTAMKMLRDGDELCVDFPSIQHAIDYRICRDGDRLFLRVKCGTFMIHSAPVTDENRDALLEEFML